MGDQWHRSSPSQTSNRNTDTQAKLADLRTLVARTERRFASHWQGPRTPSSERIKARRNNALRWSLGIPEIDNVLPESGLAIAAVHEVSGATYGDSVAAAGYVLALLKQLVRPSKSVSKTSVLWCQTTKTRSEFGAIHGSGLKAFGLDPGAFLFADAKHNRDALWAIEDGARTEGLSAVVGDIGTASFTETRRLALAAAEGKTPVLLLRPHNERRASAAETYWRITATPGAPNTFVPSIPEHSRWHVELNRCRGGKPGMWSVEWSNETHRLGLVREFSSRSPQATDASMQWGTSHPPERWRASA